MKKVLMVVPSFSAKGGITSVVSGYKNITVDDYKIKFVETYCDGSKIKKIFKFISGLTKYLYYMIMWNPDIVHVHSSFGKSFSRKKYIIRIAKIFNKRIINHIHGADFDEFYTNTNKKMKNRIIKTYNCCDVIIALSEEWKNKLSIIIDERKIRIVENYGVIHKSDYSRKNNHSVLFLGFICERKGCFDIPLVVKKVKEKIPNVKFILCGSGTSDDIDKLKKQIIENNVCDNVIFPGWVKDNKKRELLENSNLFFLPSYNEGMPMAILDAMGYALPIISTTVGGISKIVKNDYNGYIYKPGEIDKFSNAIIGLLNDENKLEAFGCNSIKVINNGYSFDNHIKKIFEIYNEGDINDNN